ncbi:hypothetical protein SAMN05443549_11210 [Flavobacterium fluvii]|uniref:Outer membrane protein beta-barrel domain-containing protein n=1 Tax=Flavobacterium fluvii TaxID=468056 RepID=A0A1M5PNF9_9FLAO|nr:hypothetical protein [Flavobacterium fluvii]SHH03228.1 hypothetical protein SAMN05443549_11210 [Flavobacterium fluvii]
MKKSILTLIMFFLFCFAYSQESKKDEQLSKGYIGLSLGVALPNGYLTSNGYDAGAGVNYGFINAGYRFSERFGATLNWGGTTHLTGALGGEIYALKYFAIGPMVSFSLKNKKIGFDLKPQFAFTTLSVDNDQYDGSDNLFHSSTLGVLFGGTVNFSLARHWCLPLNFDYLVTKFDEISSNGASGEYKVGSFNISTGLQYKF